MSPPTHKLTWRVGRKDCESRGTRTELVELRYFMMHVSPLRRDNISKVKPLKKKERAT